jgi:hypothetical protein
MSLSMMNMFSLLDDDIEMDTPTPEVVYDANGNIDYMASNPYYAELCTALSRGESWYDIMYPRDQTNEKMCKSNLNMNQTNQSKWIDAGRKRKRSADSNGKGSKKYRQN